MFLGGGGTAAAAAAAGRARGCRGVWARRAWRNAGAGGQAGTGCVCLWVGSVWQSQGARARNTGCSGKGVAARSVWQQSVRVVCRKGMGGAQGARGEPRSVQGTASAHHGGSTGRQNALDVFNIEIIKCMCSKQQQIVQRGESMVPYVQTNSKLYDPQPSKRALCAQMRAHRAQQA